MTLKEQMDRLSNLYTATGADWSLTISVSLTEPTCPSASVAPDDDEEMNGLMRYVSWGDSIEDAATRAMNLAYKELISGETITPDAPWTNPADKKFFDWLARRREAYAKAVASHVDKD